jgi:hypothetical protein
MNFHQTLQSGVGVQVTAHQAEAEIEVDTDVDVATELPAETVVNPQSSSPLFRNLPVSQGLDSSVDPVLFDWIPTVPATRQFANKVSLLLPITCCFCFSLKLMVSALGVSLNCSEIDPE